VTCRVKVCGLRRPGDAEAAVVAGAHYLGMVFAPSPRRVTEEEAREVCRIATASQPVAVFVDESPQEILRLKDRIGFTTAQLHGSESPSDCELLREGGLRVWKALRPRSRTDLVRLWKHWESETEVVLVDAWSPAARGGTGTTFPHGWLSDLRMTPPNGGQGRPSPPAGEPTDPGRKASLALAGGLTPDNVAAAIKTGNPAIVDVSSGVEVAPGVKDPSLIMAFVQAVGAIGPVGAPGTVGAVGK